MENKQQGSIFTAEGAKAGMAYKEYIFAFFEAIVEPTEKGGMHLVRDKEIEIIKTAHRAFLAYYQHTLDQNFDKYRIPQQGEGVETDTDICNGCWCDTCIRLTKCDKYPATDGITPPPCAVCGFLPLPITPRTSMPCDLYSPPPPPPEVGWKTKEGNNSDHSGSASDQAPETVTQAHKTARSLHSDARIRLRV
jgi:hypothetical protein